MRANILLGSLRVVPGLLSQVALVGVVIGARAMVVDGRGMTSVFISGRLVLPYRDGCGLQGNGGVVGEVELSLAWSDTFAGQLLLAVVASLVFVLVVFRAFTVTEGQHALLPIVRTRMGQLASSQRSFAFAFLVHIHRFDQFIAAVRRKCSAHRSAVWSFGVRHAAVLIVLVFADRQCFIVAFRVSNPLLFTGALA